MTNSSDRSAGSHLATPRIEELLARLHKRLTAQILLHGSGTLLFVTSLCLCFAFFADWILHVPIGVRWFHIFVLLALPCFFFWRELLRHLRRRPDDEGLAVLLERAHPELAEIVVSAVQLRDTPTEAPEHELVRRVVQDAEQRVEALDIEPVLDKQAPGKRFASGALAAGVTLLLFVVNGEASSIFFARLLGQDVSWPQETRLVVEIPMSIELAQIELDRDRIHVRTARGNDVPILVRAEGVVPDVVTLHFEGGQVSQLPASGKSVFRTLLRSCQEDLSFYVTGGDDLDELPLVSVEVLQPPDVTGVAIRVQPPGYSGLPEIVEYDRDVEVLAGSVVSVVMQSEPENAMGLARLLPEDRELQLESVTWPSADPSALPQTALGFEVTPDRSLRYRFELRDEKGLQNPDPGLFAIDVVEDRVPEVEILAPGRSDVETVLGGALPLRVRVSDDFGISEVLWASETRLDGEAQRAEGLLEPRALQITSQGNSRTYVRAACSGFAAHGKRTALPHRTGQ